MFASKTIAGHLLRGFIGLAVLSAAVMLTESQPWLALALLPLALLALRGCPTCWTIGLIQTVHAKLSGRSAAGLCRDGSCSAAPGRVEP